MADLTTADVYEDASLIGQDIEKLIQRFGHDAVLDLMPKVICVLEKLEVVVGEREKDKLEIAELKLENERLYWEITKEATQRRKLDEELYQISASGESDNLKSMLVKLKEENRRLRQEYEVSANAQPVTAYISAPGDAELMHKMKETIDSQRDMIRVKNQEIDSQRNDIEAIGEQIERLTSINQSVRRSLASSQERISALAKEKAELQTELQAYRRTSQTQELNDNSGEDSEGNESFTDSEAELEGNGKSMSEELEEDQQQKCEDEETEPSISSSGKPPPKPPRLHLDEEVEENGDELNNNDKNVLPDWEKKNSGEIKVNGLENDSDEGEWELVERQRPLNKEEKTEKQNGSLKEERVQNNKERKDPNRPRYTKAELLEILIERNKLKEKVWALNEELAIYKPRETGGDGEDSKLPRTAVSPRKESRKEDSGISRIFNIFARKGEA